MADEFPPQDIDIDEQTLEIMREHQAALVELRARIEQATNYTERRQLLVEFQNEVKRQEGIFAETPGLESYARRLRETREQFQKHYGLS
jgi:hypothetical protein